jgi:hypothetical protein
LSNIGIFTYQNSAFKCGSCGCWSAERKLFGEISTLRDCWPSEYRRHADQEIGDGVAGLVVTLVGLPTTAWLGAAFGLILVATLIPAGYSLVHYKRLQSHGEL